jgi:hypothetical protein
MGYNASTLLQAAATLHAGSGRASGLGRVAVFPS